MGRHERSKKYEQSNSSTKYSQDYSRVPNRPDHSNIDDAPYPDREIDNRFLCDPSFNWEKHRSSLNKMFFSDRDIIKRGSQEYDNFWPFLRKYQAIQSKRPIPNMDPHNSSQTENQSLPTEFHPWHKINFNLNFPTTDDLMAKAFIFRDEIEEARQIPRARVEEFKYILHLYVDFLQKQRFVRMKKLRESQKSLPIYQFKDKIIKTVKENQVVLIAGDTGCGKSTQVPQYLMEAGFTKVACTQPRRIACISLSKRVAHETLNEYGTEIGYQIRFEKSRTKHTRILFLTEGLLLRQVASDPMLSTYDVLILDEVHERHIPCDFLLGIVKCLVHQRKDLKVILMSATINIELFADYFNSCPVIQVPGRLFPIKVHYQPIQVAEKTSSSSRIDPSPYLRIMHQIDEKYPAEERGDMLVFLSGMTEISTVAEAAQQYASQNNRWIILQLHSSLSLEEQDKVFGLAPEGVRKCILSTNIAETSVTIDGVRFVVDSGKVKEMSYDSACRLQRLKEFWISRASAEQRKGRAGRTGPGICYRLYSETDYCKLEAYSTPEIQRVPLHSLLLQMVAMGLPDARKFPFLEPPDAEAVEGALANLKDEGALNDEEDLTPMGQMLAKLPVDVTLGKMLILGSVFDLLEPALTLAAILSVQSPLTPRSFRDPDAIAARKSLESSHGDPFTLLNAYNEWLLVKMDPDNNSRKWCRKRGLEEQRFYEITKLRRQFKSLLQDAGLVEEKMHASTSSERAQRHGELRHLRQLKRSIHTAPKTRKKLKLDSSIELYSAEDQEEREPDLRDVEFRMANASRDVTDLRRANQSLGSREIKLLKIILCSGLYPQLALSDEFNSHKSNSEQLFHTKGKPYVSLHPNSVFALQPDLLHLSSSDIQHVSGFITRQPVSTRHQLVAFMSLLETTKPYLVNVLRVPVAHTCALLGRVIDTNQDFTRLVIDGWLEVRFPSADDAQAFISLAMDIRDTWHQLLQATFQECFDSSEMSSCKEWSPELADTRRKLTKKILQFLGIEILHTVKRLLAADIKELYVGPDSTALPDQSKKSKSSNFSEKESSQSSPHPIKGGVQLRDYLVYNCLLDADQTLTATGLLKEWTCPHCEQEFTLTVLDRVRHEAQCKNASAPADQDLDPKAKANKKPYYCPDCQEEIFLSPTEMLKHKISHSRVTAKAPE